ncbi:MAG: GGDEF domain-containing protein [Halieaceae bacterium]
MNHSEQYGVNKARLIANTALLMIAITIIGGLSRRLLMGEFHAPGLAAQGASVVALFWVHSMATRGELVQAAAIALLAVMTANQMGYSLLTGGISGPVILVSPLAPLLANLLIGPRTSWLLTAVLIAFIALIGLMGLPADTAALPIPEALARISSLAGAMVAINCIGWYYASTNASLVERLWHESRHDHLTGVANRQHIEELLEKELARARRNQNSLSVLVIDVDEFKQLNERLGHAAGDRCLQQVAGIIGEELRRPADALGRFGGEEFIALLPETDFEGAMHKAGEIRAAIASQVSYKYQGQQVPATVTVGVSTQHGRHNRSIESIIAAAEANMGKANDDPAQAPVQEENSEPLRQLAAS